MSEATQTHTEFPCTNCGAKLHYAPGTTSLACPYCGSANEIALAQEEVREMDYLSALRQGSGRDEQIDVVTVKCTSCAAESVMPPGVTADRCAFCGTPLVAQASSRKLIKPRSLLPFAIGETLARQAFKNWIDGLWFAPSGLKQETAGVRLRGIYIPAWTYDSQTTTDYTGQRGDDYWETQTHTVHRNGKAVRETRRVRKTRWRGASGRVSNTFDDVLVLATQSLPLRLAQKLEPWDMKALVPYQDEFISGFVCESYHLDVEQGFGSACQSMKPHIETSIRQDIGGDHQRIHSVNTHYSDITYKHILLPVWLCAYLYRGQTYRFLVNARTGEVQGERPYSALKVTLLVLLIIAAIATIALVLAQR